jgi:hypothetical protein
MRTLFGIGTPRSLQGHTMAGWAGIVALLTLALAYWKAYDAPFDHSPTFTPHLCFELFPLHFSKGSPLTSGC